MKFSEVLNQEIKKAFRAAGFDDTNITVSVSNRPDLAEFQCNGAMALAKTLHTAPIEVAKKVVEAIPADGIFQKTEAVLPGFINLTVSPSKLVDFAEEMAFDEHLGATVLKTPEKVVLDYGGPNVAKPLHIGHLRSAVIGESLKRILTFAGYEVTGDAHLGDWGLQIGLIIEELKEEKPSLSYFHQEKGPFNEEAPFTISELESIYPRASAKSKEDASFASRAEENTRMLQNGYAPYVAIWEQIRKVSIADLKKNYAKLNVSFDLWNAESDAEPYIPELLSVLQEKGLLHESEGAMVVDVREDTDKIEVPPCIVKKSNGASLYATTDLATIIDRMKNLHPAKMIYITDKRQSLHFQQVFRVAKKAALISPETTLTHIGFGTMNGKDGKPFKTRSGGVMRLEMLLQETYDAVLEKLSDRYGDEEEKGKIASAVSLAAIKYGDLSNQAAKDYNFDLDRFASFEGNTGPYILYSIVRIHSILAKGKSGGVDFGDSPSHHLSDLEADNPYIKNLLKSLVAFPDVFDATVLELAPHKLCTYLHDLCDTFNSFYAQVSILKESGRKLIALLSLICLIDRVLNTGIDLLGFYAPEKM